MVLAAHAWHTPTTRVAFYRCDNCKHIITELTDQNLKPLRVPPADEE